MGLMSRRKRLKLSGGQKDANVQKQIAELQALKMEVVANQLTSKQQMEILKAQDLLIASMLERLSNLECRFDRNDEMVKSLEGQNEEVFKYAGKINDELMLLKNKPKGLDRFNVKIQEPKQKPLED